jgi:hypothetical protein
MLNRQLLVDAIAREAESGGAEHEDLRLLRERLHKMGLSELGEQYKKLTDKDPHELKAA